MPCNHDYEHPIRKGRAHYVCPKCNKDITLELVLISESESFYLPCGHTLLEHQMMEEAKASSEIEGAKTDRTICELIDLSK